MAKHRKKLSAKQIRYFGTPAQKAGLKRKRKHHAKAKSSHRRRTKSNPHRTRRRAVARKSNPHRTRRRATAKRSTHRRRTAKRRNPVPQIIAWTATGNPARRKKGKKAMAKRRTKRRATARHSNAGRRRTHKVVHHRRRSNPGGLGRPIDWVTGGAGVLAGSVLSRAIPQMLLTTSNAGAMGYAANAVASLALGWAAQMFFKKPVLTAAVIAGGFGSLIQRVIADKTSYGAALSMAGLGDWGLGLYQKSNFNNPQRIVAPRGPNSSMFTWGAGDQAIPSLANAGADSSLNC